MDEVVYGDFVAEIAYQVLTSTNITTKEDDMPEPDADSHEQSSGQDTEEVPEIGTLDCLFLLIDLIGQCQTGVFQWGRMSFGF